MNNMRKQLERQNDAMRRSYMLCPDYEILRIILDYTPAFGLVDHINSDDPEFVMRDVVVIRKISEDRYRAGARGITYIETSAPEGWEGFVRQAQKHNLAFVIPDKLHAHDGLMEGGEE